MKKRFIFTIFLLAPLIMYAKKELPLKITVSGVVLDSQSEQPLIGAVIKEFGTNNGVSTDVEGKFSIDLTSLDSKIEVSYIGYISQVFEVKNEFMTLHLASDAVDLEELLVVGYGKSSKELFTGAAKSVGLAQVNNQNIDNTTQYLQGRVPGVTVINNGGDPGSTPQILFRGTGTLNNENPLWVVDGVPFNDGAPNLNPADIANMTVIKDASTAIYGSRASAGVILVETKKAKNGLKVNLNTSFGFQKVHQKLKSLDAKQMADVQTLAANNAGIKPSDAFNPTLNPDGQITRTNWVDEIFRTGFLTDNTISISYGGQKANLYTSFGYRKNDGTLLNTSYDRVTARVNFDYQLLPKLTFRNNFFVSNTNGVSNNTTSAYTGIIFTALSYPASASVRDLNNPSLWGGISSIEFAGAYGDLINPVAALERRDEKNPINNINAISSIEYEIFAGLKAKANFNLGLTNSNHYVFEPRVPEIGKRFDNNYLTLEDLQGRQTLQEYTLAYDSFWGKSGFDILAGYNFQTNTKEYTRIRATGFDNEDPSLRQLINASEIINLGDETYGIKTEDVLMSYLARANYNFDQRYLLSGTIRRDGSSRLPSGKKWGTFGSISGGWIISNENFFNKTSAINFLKLRGSWGRVGNVNSLGLYEGFARLKRLNALVGQDEGVYTGYALANIINPNLTWETSQQLDLGLEMNFLSNKIQTTLDYYDRKTKDMILPVNLPSTAGVSEVQYANTGVVSNKGFEFGINYDNTFSNGLRWDVSGNFAYNKNNLDKLYSDNNFRRETFNVRSVLYPIANQVGQPLYSYWVIETAGIFQNQAEIDAYSTNGKLIQPNAKPGDLKFVDKNSDGVINDNDRVFKGNPYPKFTYGFNNTITIKNFDFTLFFQGIAGVKLFNGLKLTGYNASLQGYNSLTGILDAWSETNTGSSIPRISASDANKNFSNTSDFYLENGAYFRLKNLNVGYTFNPEKIDKIRVYASISNLFTITKYTGFDPEIGIDRKGIDVGRYPLSRSFLFGVNFNF